MRVLVNVNDRVKVKLTEKGRDIYWRATQIETTELNTSLWNLFSVFGAHMHIGSVALFENNDIEIGG